MTHHRARKRFGQNFLVDHSVIDRILRATSASASDHFLEIGPGKGALSLPLSQHCAKLTLIELDRDLIPLLNKAFHKTTHVHIHQADALKVDFRELVSPEHPVRVIGNLPYNISTPLIFHLFDYVSLIKDITIMLQYEVVERMAAEPGNKHYGRLSVMVQYHADVRRLFTVPPTAFQPVPSVNSAVVRLTPKTRETKAHDLSRFTDIVRQAFNQRRKTLRNSLKNLINVQELERLGIEPCRRAEELTVADYIALSNGRDDSEVREP